jgi:hypothetical protein
VSDAKLAADASCIPRFLDFIALEEGLSRLTQNAYEKDLTRFAEYADAKGAAAPLDGTARMLREFVYHLKDLGLSPASIRRNVSAIRTYFRFLIGDGIVVRDPSERLETPSAGASCPTSSASRRSRSSSPPRRSTTTWSSATARSSSWPTAPACASRSGSRSPCAICSSRGAHPRLRQGQQGALVPSDGRRSAPWRSTCASSGPS